MSLLAVKRRVRLVGYSWHSLRIDADYSVICKKNLVTDLIEND